MSIWWIIAPVTLSLTVPFIVGAVIYPENRTFFLIMVLGGLCLVAIALLLKKQRHSSTKKTIASVVADFGKIVSSDSDETIPTVCFERNGTIFKTLVWESKYHCEYQINFSLQTTGEKFFIQDDTNVFPKNHLSDCQAVNFPALKKSFLLYSRNSGLLSSLLDKKDIRLQLEKYPENTFMIPSLLKIAFEDGHFEIIWRNSYHDLNNNIRRVCDTAIVFHAKIRELI